MLTTTARNAIQALQTCGVNAAPMRRSTAQSSDFADRTAVLIGQVARDAACGERLQRRDQKRQVAERAERKLERILELGALDRDVAMEARTQVRRNDEQALVELTAQRHMVDGRLCEGQSDDLDLLGSHRGHPWCGKHHRVTPEPLTKC